MKIKYIPQYVCCDEMILDIEWNIINSVEFIGGCMGNLSGIASLVRGMTFDEVIEKLKGIDCGGKGTSCPDQLAKCLLEVKNLQEQKISGKI